jgi:hypothetical protein
MTPMTGYFPDILVLGRSILFRGTRFIPLQIGELSTMTSTMAGHAKSHENVAFVSIIICSKLYDGYNIM